MRLAKICRMRFIDEISRISTVDRGASNRIVYNTNLEHLLRDHSTRL